VTPPKNTKSRCHHHLKKEILQTPPIKAIYPLTGRFLHQDDDNYQAKMGAHSNHKYGKTRALKRWNCAEKEADWHGRWKDVAHASSVYGE
jgi:hypothetical protein